MSNNSLRTAWPGMMSAVAIGLFALAVAGICIWEMCQPVIENASMPRRWYTVRDSGQWWHTMEDVEKAEIGDLFTKLLSENKIQTGDWVSFDGLHWFRISDKRTERKP